MKTEDYERLKKLCDENGFEIISPGFYQADFHHIVSKKKEDTEDKVRSICDKIIKDLNDQIDKNKDIWEGVEFYEDPSTGKIKPMTNYVINSLKKGIRLLIHPSTEKAYVEQLKAKAFELYGEIKEGDKFENPSGGTREVDEKSNDQWEYYKGHDQLFFYNVELYCEGKWAKRLPKRIEVESKYSFLESSREDLQCNFELSQKINDIEGVGQFLAKQLEEYLNK